MSSDKLQFFLFADDTNLLYADKSLKSLETTVNEELMKVYNWLTANKLSLNAKKSNYVIFRPYQKRIDYQVIIKIYDHAIKAYVSLESKDYVKYLGIIIDANLTWKAHVDYIALKISKTVGIISRIRHFLPRRTLLNIYKTLILPYLQYGIAIWGQASNTHLQKLLKLQKRVLRLIYFVNYKVHAIPLFLSSNMLPLNMMYLSTIMYTMYDTFNKCIPSKILNLFIFTNDVHTFNTRSTSSEKYYVKFSRTNQQRCSFSRIGAEVWNDIPLRIRKYSKNKFRSEVKDILFKIFSKEDSYLDTATIIDKLRQQWKYVQ